MAAGSGAYPRTRRTAQREEMFHVPHHTYGDSPARGEPAVNIIERRH